MNIREYFWQDSADIKQLLIQIEALKLAFPMHPQLQDYAANFRRGSLLKSAVYSARIEGFDDTETSPKRESQNLLTAYNQIITAKQQKISDVYLRHLHRQVLNNISTSAGLYRKEPWAIYDQFGSVVYLAPLHTEIPQLIKDYLQFLQKNSDHPVIQASIAQFIFEKIHPFGDGNGRVGRLISSFILQKSGYHFENLIPLEEYIDGHKSDYYSALTPSHNMTEFIKFFLTALLEQGKKTLDLITNTPSSSTSNLISPRRQEILSILQDHPFASFDLIHRRFPALNPKTLHYDLGWLIKHGFIQKAGTTRGATYILKQTQ
jgi:Fic family protein